jgi:P4 family phage/plasmid primase-like protien
MTSFTIYTANTTGAKQNKVYPNEVTVDNLSALEQAMRRDHVCAKYTGNVRGVANFQYADCIPMDCDNDHSDNPDDWKSPEDVKKAFPGVAFAVSFSRNHMKEKKGKAARPKFHCYFPIKRISSVEQYVAMKKQIRKKFPEFDANALDGGRFLFGVEDPQIMYFKGKKTVDELFILAGGRNGTLYKKACQLIKRYGEAEAKAYFDAEAAKCVPPLEQQELDAIWSNAQKYGREMSSAEGYIPPEQFSAPQEYLKKIRPEDNKAYPWTELGAGQLFADFYKDVLRYVPERKSWFYYNGVVWEQDLGNTKTMEMCKDLARYLGIYCLSIEDDKRREEYAKFCYRWQTRKMRETVIRDAQSVHTISMEEFDTDPYIFNCKNGTLHLKTMEFTPHRPEDKLTKHSDVEYNPDASCERFERFMAEITNGDQKKAKFLQKVLGYGLSGDTRFECMFIFYGATTRNGKGTLCESVLKVIGHYGCTSQAETIGIKPNKSSQMPSEDVARLVGVRFVNISEPDRSLRLDAALVKTMTGNDTMNARFLHENSFDFKPQFKLYINTNYRPAISDLTLFSSDRVIIVTFDRHFGEKEQDKNLKELFAMPNSQSAILNWLLDGYRLIHSEGLVIPESVKVAIEEYRKDSDKVARFTEDCLEKIDGAEVRTSAVYKAYTQWCEDNGCRPENSAKFNQALSSFATLERKRPKGGGNSTTILIGYTLSGSAQPL